MFVVENRSEWFFAYQKRTGKYLFFNNKKDFIQFLAKGYFTKTYYNGVKYSEEDTEHKHPILCLEEKEINIYQNGGFNFFNALGQEVNPFFLYEEDLEKVKVIEKSSKKRHKTSPYSFTYRKGPVPQTGKVRYFRSGGKKLAFYKHNIADGAKSNEWRRAGRHVDYWCWDDYFSKWDCCRSWKKYRKHQWKKN